MSRRENENERTPVLRVMTWNLWWRFGPWWSRQGPIAEVLAREGADVIGLQEVWVEEDGAHQADVLARRLRYHHVAGDVTFRDGVAMTNAVLSRWPIRRYLWRRLPDSTGGLSHRSVLAAEIDAPFGRLLFVTTHLDHAFDGSAQRVSQVRAVASLVAACRDDAASGYPTVLTGDLNAVPDADEVRGLTGATAPLVNGLVFTDAWAVAGGADPGHTWNAANPYLADASWPNRRLDYIMVSWPRPKPRGSVTGVHLAGTEPIAGVVASDHYGVVADLRT